ncbi:LAMI_0F08262g1_1 [Lachancea mirantina]|uniref:LAMI_0F08262g1_1 n=1 Tax=Lachancea mirantina TaxID=1230905 RepID=A0A1G4K0B0_9SACH|nr:LAMI_0F08262g1_1 [Lachancea mirantina]
MVGQQRKIIEINGDNEKIILPIVKFPPFRLRSAMIEKDPVVWVHLLETYNKYMHFLLRENKLNEIDEKTYLDLCGLVKSYLHELSDEEGKLLSLGMNAEVIQQLKLLRAFMFNLIQRKGLLGLNATPGMTWDFVRLYVRDNVSTVQSLVVGNVQQESSPQTTQISHVFQVHKRLRELVESEKFTRVDLKALESLLANDEGNRELFADSFLTVKWMEGLEDWFAQGASKNNDLARNLAVLSYLSASETRIAAAAAECHIRSAKDLAQYPLFGCIVTCEAFRLRKPLSYRLSFIPEDSPLTDFSAGIELVKEVFPALADDLVRRLLEKHEGKVELVINDLFENPSLARESENMQAKDASDTVFQEDLKPEEQISKDSAMKQDGAVPDEARNRLLTRTLKLLYKADEDERDDTYDEADVQHKTSEDAEGSNVKMVSETDKIEGRLWNLLKENKNLFERSARGSKARKGIKQEISWSDEQIEGWARMIERSPQRAQILEDKYTFRGNFRSGKKSFNQKRYDQTVEQTPGEPSDRQMTPKVASPARPNNKEQQRRQNARNEKNKANRANHNRKNARDKKTAKATV